MTYLTMLQTFDIAGPVTATIDEKVATTTAAVGTCTTDTFSLASDGNQGTPIICGYNTGQHVLVDVDNACATASFSFNKDSSHTRYYNIKARNIQIDICRSKIFIVTFAGDSI